MLLSVAADAKLQLVDSWTVHQQPCSPHMVPSLADQVCLPEKQAAFVIAKAHLHRLPSYCDYAHEVVMTHNVKDGLLFGLPSQLCCSCYGTA